MSFKLGIVGFVESFEEEERGFAEATGAATTAASFRLRGHEKTYTILPDRFFEFHAALVRERAGEEEAVYVETDPSGELATRILIPDEVRIADIFEDEWGLVVRQVASQAPLRLPKDSPDSFRNLLERAQQSHEELLVTDDPVTHEILDVRVPFGGAEGSGGPAPPTSTTGPVPLVPSVGLAAPSTLSLRQARFAFDFLANQSHIRFDYPDDYCLGRAHEMCRLLTLHKFKANKIWNYEERLQIVLHFFTINHPHGVVPWVFHAAPLVLVRLPNKNVVEMVLDPAMFHHPARVKQWIALQHGVNPMQSRTDSTVFSLFPPEDDPSFTTTNKQLRSLIKDSYRRRIELGW